MCSSDLRDLYYPVTLAENADPASLLARGPKPELSIADLRAAGITSPLSLPADQPLMLVDLPNGANPPSYVIGTGNFYAITRYNRSFFYAMAVTELAKIEALPFITASEALQKTENGVCYIPYDGEISPLDQFKRDEVVEEIGRAHV